MKPIIRCVILLVLIILTVGGLPSTVQSVSAQSSCKVKGLSNADCQLLADASGNLDKLQSFVMTYNVTFQAKGISSGNIDFSAQGTGPVDVSAVDPASMMDTLSQTVLASKLNAKMTVGPNTLNGTLDIRIVDGFLYVAGTQVPQKPGAKIDLAKLIGALPAQSTAVFTKNGSASFDLWSSIQSGPAVNIPGVYQARSQPGKAIDGQATTQISLDLNLYPYLTYLSAPEHRAEFKAVAEAGGQTLTDDQINQLARAIPLLKTTLLATKIQETWSIGKRDKLYHGWGFTFSTKIDRTLVNLISGKDDALAAQPISASGSIQVTLSQVGKPVSVKAIDGAEDITDNVMAQFPGGTSSSGSSGNSGNSGNTGNSGGNGNSDIDAFIPDDVNTRYADIRVGKTSDGFATLGNANAPVKIVQLSSYSCAPCQQFYTETLVPVLDEMQSGNVYYTFIPVTLTGEFDAAPVTAAAYCALQQGKFWQMHDVLFDWQVRYGSDSSDPDRLDAGAKALGMDVAKFDTCLTSPQAEKFIKAGNDHFRAMNLESTPSVFINGKLFHPAPDGEIEPDLRDYIEQLVAGGKPG